MAASRIGFVGVGTMGSRMAGKLFSEKHDLIVWNRSAGPAEGLFNQCRNSTEEGHGSVTIAKTLPELVENLVKPRVIWTMLPAGEATE